VSIIELGVFDRLNISTNKRINNNKPKSQKPKPNAIPKSLPHLAAFLYLASMTIVLPIGGMGALSAQLPDLIFLLSFPFVLWHYREKVFAVGPLLWIGGFYVGANLLSAGLSGSTSAIVESLARGYLMLLGFWMAAWLREGGLSDLWPRIRKVIMWVGIVWAGMSLLFYFSHFIWGHGIGLREYAHYPYLGAVARINGGTTTSNLFLWALGPAFFLLFEAKLAGKRVGNFVFLVGLALLLTLSKALMLYAAYVLLRLLEQYCRVYRPLIPRLIVIGATIFLYLGTHFVWKASEAPVEIESVYYEQEPLYSSSMGDVYLSSYSSIKIANAHIFKAHPWFGVGPGQSKKHIPDLIDRGLYPAHLPVNEPHSSLFGAASETGILGLLSLILLIGYSVYHFLPLAQTSDPTLRALLYFLLFLLIASFQQDVMNFRFLWVIWGVLLGWRSLLS
jgi:O-antigen ligase